MNYGDCIGCGLCVMGCPAFEDTHAEALTAKGRNRALQAGLAPAEMTEIVWACTLCGYCDGVCPRDVKNVEIVLSLRRALSGRDVPAPADRRGGIFFGCATPPELRDGILRATGEPAAAESSCCGANEVEAGHAKEAAVGDVTVVDPRCYWGMRRSGANVRYLGARLAPRAKLRPGDLYFVPSLLVNTWHDEFYPLFHAVRERTGAKMNLDLNRLARSTGAGAVQGGRELAAGVRRIVESAKPARIVTCSPADYQAFRQFSGVETRFITECL